MSKVSPSPNVDAEEDIQGGVDGDGSSVSVEKASAEPTPKNSAGKPQSRRGRTVSVEPIFLVLVAFLKWTGKHLPFWGKSDRQRQKLVRHNKAQFRLPEPREVLRWVWRYVVGLFPLYGPLVAYFVWRDEGQRYPEFLSQHLALGLMSLLPIISVVVYMGRNYGRTHPPKPKRGPKPEPKPALPSVWQRLKDNQDIVANLDPVRPAYWVLAVAAVYVAGHHVPVSLDQITRVASSRNTEEIQRLALPFLAVFVAWLVQRVRCALVNHRRFGEIEECYQIVRASLAGNSQPRKGQMREATPWQTVQVKTWNALYEIDEAFVVAPRDLSVKKEDPWNDFSANLNSKMPRPEEWRVRRDPRGRGAHIEAANYPTAVLWDGQYDPDPLTFWLGKNLNTGKNEYLTFNDASPHMALSGASSSGKTSLAEVIAAQTLVKPMPWDNTLFGWVAIIDPKGPFARRWAGRRGVSISSGQDEMPSTDEEGNPITLTGPSVMHLHLEWLEREHERRQKVLARYPDIGSWVDMPNDVKRKERFFPIFVILDEYLDHTDKEQDAGDSRVIRENASRAGLTRLATWHARKYRNVGMHTILIAQEVKMSGNTGIGSAFMRNLPVRGITGGMDSSQKRTMFGEREDIPSLPATRFVIGEDGEKKAKTIPGRAQIMNAAGQEIRNIQVGFFGGEANIATLDKWLPRGEKAEPGDFTPAKGGTVVMDEDGNVMMPEKGAEDPESDLRVDPDDDSDADATEATSETAEPEAPWKPTPAPLVEQGDGNPIFPASGQNVLVCARDNCVEDATQKCSDCSAALCAEHVRKTPEGDVVCPDCQVSDAVVAYGLEDLNRFMEEMATKHNLTMHRAAKDGMAVMSIRTADDKKVVEVTGDGSTVLARSRSGEVKGEDAAEVRIRRAVETHAQRMAEQDAATPGVEGGTE